jgi:hypothetical protein
MSKCVIVPSPSERVRERKKSSELMAKKYKIEHDKCHILRNTMKVILDHNFK